MLIDIPFRQIWPIGSEEWLVHVRSFRDALFVACEKFEVEQAVKAIAEIAAERERDRLESANREG